MCAPGQLVCFTCMATVLFAGLESDAVISPNLEELMMGCIHVKLLESLESRDEQAQYQLDEYHERKRTRIARLIIDIGKRWHHIFQINVGGAMKLLTHMGCQWHGYAATFCSLTILNITICSSGNYQS